MTIQFRHDTLKIMRISRRRKKIQPKKRHFANELIRAPKVRVIGEAGEIGIMPTAEAIRLANEQGLDLVQINPKGEPPVCKIMDFGHFKYQKEKEERLQKAHARATEVKGIRLSVRIGKHDLDVRKKQALKFLERGDKLKIELIMRGRERTHKDRAQQIIKEFTDIINTEMPVKVDQAVTQQGNKLFAVIMRV